MAKYETYRDVSHEFANISLPVFAIPLSYTYEDIDDNDQIVFVIQKGFAVLAVWHEVVTPFSLIEGSGGGSNAVDIGDGSTADAYFAQADLTLSSQGDFKTSLLSAEPLSNGITFNTAGKIVLTFAGTFDAGAGKLYVLAIDTTGNWRTAGYL